jgi:hypothetical protein
MNTQCIFCFVQCMSSCCSRCNQMSRGQKFERLLQHLEKCSESMLYHDEIASAVQRIQQVSLLYQELSCTSSILD